MKLITWNVNGMRAILKKGFLDFCTNESADIYCLQETKMQPGQATVDLDGYEEYWNSADRKGYSGTAVFTRIAPLSYNYDIDADGHNDEGRSITLEFEEFYLVNESTPNAQDGLKRIDYRMKWEDARRKYLKNLDSKKPVILCGDLNVAHNEIDLKNPKNNRGNAGFSDEERGKFGALLDSGFTDIFRSRNPKLTGAYTWWSYRFNARANNAGWRIDYFLISDRAKDKVKEITILNDVMGSDHCPVRLEIEF